MSGQVQRLPDGDPQEYMAERRAKEAWEAGFLDRVMRMSAWTSIFCVWFLLALGRHREALSFGIGAALALAMLWSTRYAVTHVFARADLGKRKRWTAVALVAGKYGLAGMLIWWLTRWPGAHLPAFIAGVAVTQAVLLLKALGRALTGEAPPARWRERFMEREHNRMRGT